MSAAAEGQGRLRTVLDAGKAEGYRLADLTVLEPGRDPYRFDTAGGHRNARWFAEQVQRLLRPDQTIHLRGLHYLIVSRGNIRRPDTGEVFANTNDDWEWLSDIAAKAARWLAYVPFDRIVDERNAPPEVIELPPHEPLRWNLSDGDGVALPDLAAALPAYWISGFTAPQR